MAISTVILNETTLMTVNDTTTEASEVLSGQQFYNAAGEKISGTIATKSAANLTASGSIVTVPSGYYASQVTKAVSAGTAGTPSATKGSVSNHSITITPTVTNSTGYIEGGTKTGTAATVSASELVSGTLNIHTNSTFDVKNYATVVTNVTTQHTCTIIESNSDDYYHGCIYYDSDDYFTVGDSITFYAGQEDLLLYANLELGGTIYYNDEIVESGTWGVWYTLSPMMPDADIEIEIHYDSDYTKSYIKINTITHDLQAKTGIVPTESSQVITADSGYYGLSSVGINAISSTYVGSGVAQRSSANLTASGSTVTVPSGYYASAASTSVASGTAGTPSASKGAVSNHSISVTPTVTNTTGYIAGGTKTGTAVTVSASELVSGTLSISSSGSAIDVTNYSAVNVPAGSVSTPAKTITVNPTFSLNSSTGVITATAAGSSSITPTVNAGYINSGTAGTVSVSGSHTLYLSTQVGTTINPTESEQTAVSAGKYTTGAVKIAAISSTYVGSGVAQKSSADLTASGSKVTAPAGYYTAAATKNIAAGAATTPAQTITVTPTISFNSATGAISVAVSSTKSIAPNINPGYISSGTAGIITVLGSSSSGLTTAAASTYTPSASTQTIPAGIFLTGAQTIAPIPISVDNHRLILPEGLITI